MNAAFFEVTSDSTTAKVHTARRKALATIYALPRFDLFGINAYPSDVKAAHGRVSAFWLFSGMGHGSPTSFEGQGGIELYNLGDTSSSNYTVRDAIVHLYSCNCGQVLGPHLISRGAKAFIGYVNPVTVPAAQSVVDEFVKVAAVIDQSIMEGDGNLTTKRKADAEFAAVEGRLLSSGSLATPREVASFRVNHRSMVGPWTSISRYGWF